MNFAGNIEITFSSFGTAIADLSDAPNCKLLTGVLIYLTVPSSVTSLTVTIDMTEWVFSNSYVGSYPFDYASRTTVE